MPMPWGRNQGNLVSVSERTADGFELATLPTQAGHAVDAPLDAFIDLRDEPAGLAVEVDPDPDITTDRGAGAGRARPHGPLPARRPRRRRAAWPPSAPAIATVVRFGSWHHKSYVALSLAVPVLWVLLLGDQARLRAALPRSRARGVPAARGRPGSSSSSRWRCCRSR